MGKGKNVVKQPVLDVVESQFERFQRIWARLYGAPGSSRATYTRSGLFVSGGVALAAVVLFVGRAERARRGKMAAVVGDGSGSQLPVEG